MSAPSNRTSLAARSAVATALTGLCLLGFASFSSSAWAQGDDAESTAKALSEIMLEDEEEKLGWEPQVGFGFGVLTMSHDGSALLPPNRLGLDPQFLQDGGDSVISEFFDFSINLYTPIQFDVPTKPRLLITSAFQLPIAEDLVANRVDDSVDQVGQNADPAAFEQTCPEFMVDGNGDPILNGLTPDPNDFIEPDTCSFTLRNRTTPLALWSAGLGMDFTLPFDEEQFHLVTTLDYMGMAVQGEGGYSRRTSTQNPGALETNIDAVDTIGDSEVFHGLSASLRLGIDAYETDEWTWQVYVAGRATYFFENPDLEAIGDAGQGDIEFVSDLAGMMYQVYTGVSVRFHSDFFR